MKYLTILCCFFAIVLAEKQLKLEDIERDNLASERDAKEQQKQPPKYSQPYNPPNYKSSSVNNFGFTPIKSASVTNQERTKIQPARLVQDIQPEPIVQEQIQYIPAQYYYQQTQQPISVQQTSQQPGQHSLVTQYPSYQPYQQYENTPYVVDNQIQQPQYVYVQPYTAPSNNVQMIVDSKGQVKYFMYLPVQYVKQDQTQSNIQYSNVPDSTYSNVGPQIFTQEPEYQQAPNSEAQYITQPQLSSKSHSQLAQTSSQVNFIPIEKNQYIPKGEPQSLLDSYVPSVLQYQYHKQQQLKQQQQIQNSLQNSLDLSKKNSGKTSHKTYSSPQIFAPSAPSELSYSLQLPSVYSRSYSNVKANTK